MGFLYTFSLCVIIQSVVAFISMTVFIFNINNSSRPSLKLLLCLLQYAGVIYLFLCDWLWGQGKVWGTCSIIKGVLSLMWRLSVSTNHSSQWCWVMGVEMGNESCSSEYYNRKGYYHCRCFLIQWIHSNYNWLIYTHMITNILMSYHIVDVVKILSHPDDVIWRVSHNRTSVMLDIMTFWLIM